MKTRILSLLSLGLTSLAFAAHHEGDPQNTPAEVDGSPMTTCVVSGETLGSMGDPYVYTYKEAGKPDREIQLCCEMCVSRFEKNPTKYLAKLDAAAKAEREHHTTPEKHGMEHEHGKDHS